jgi:hypothetical protein
MRKYLVSAALLLLSLTAYAQEHVAPVVPPTAVVAVTPAVTPAPTVTVDGAKVTVNDIVTDATEVAAAIQAYKADKAAGDKTATRLALMLLLAAIFKVLLSAVKFTSDFWKGPKGALALRVSTLVLGIAVFLTAHLGAGETVINAGLLALSGPLAISFHELFDIIVGLVQKTPATPIAPVAPVK